MLWPWLWPLYLFVPVLDRHLPGLESGKLPWRPEPPIPFRPGLDPWHPALQQVSCSLFRGACDWGQMADACSSVVLFRGVFGVRSECRPLLFRATCESNLSCSADASDAMQIENRSDTIWTMHVWISESTRTEQRNESINPNLKSLLLDLPGLTP